MRPGWHTFLCVGLAAGCGSDDPLVSDQTEAPPTTFGGDRPVELQVPSSYDPDEPAPLLFLLHGLGASGELQEIVFRLGPVAEEHGILYAHPDGTRDSEGRLFWNATEQCCDFDDTGVDDSGYLIGLVDEISAAYNVDPKRIYFTGHSNGHFMSYRMACDHAGHVAAIAGLAGGTFSDPADCEASEPVQVLHMHGTEDDLVPYDPAATMSVAFWADRAGCSEPPAEDDPVDLDSTIEGTETKVQRYEDCDPGGAAELWTIEGGHHIPNLAPDFPTRLVEWLLAHPKP